MLQLPLKQECKGGLSKEIKGLWEKTWPEMSAIALRWVASEGHFFRWEKLPFCTNNWRPWKVSEAFGEDGASFKSVESQEATEMDERIWGALPEDVIEKVLTRLPLSSVLRFRSVCRRWNSVVLSGTFISSHSEISAHRPWFVLCTVGQLACSFDPCLNKWLSVLKPASPGTSVIASAGSLFCLGNQVAECKVLSVCNPISRCLRHLPSMLKVRLIHKVAMLEERSTNTFKILVAGEDGLQSANPYTYTLFTEVYDSATNSWTMAGNPLPEAKFGSDPGVWCNGLFYCITELPYGVVTFDITTGEWSELDVPMPSSIAIPSLLNLRGRLLMVGRVLDHGESRPKTKGICIWELHPGRRQWVELQAMPAAVCGKFLAPLASYSPFVCAGIGSSIFITTHLSPQVLVFDVSNDSWRWLPSDPLFPKLRDFHLLGFCFEPRFDACP